LILGLLAETEETHGNFGGRGLAAGRPKMLLRADLEDWLAIHPEEALLRSLHQKLQNPHPRGHDPEILPRKVAVLVLRDASRTPVSVDVLKVSERREGHDVNTETIPLKSPALVLIENVHDVDEHSSLRNRDTFIFLNPCIPACRYPIPVCLYRYNLLIPKMAYL